MEPEKKKKSRVKALMKECLSCLKWNYTRCHRCKYCGNWFPKPRSWK